jgi:hypothetical protein
MKAKNSSRAPAPSKGSNGMDNIFGRPIKGMMWKMGGVVGKSTGMSTGVSTGKGGGMKGSAGSSKSPNKGGSSLDSIYVLITGKPKRMDRGDGTATLDHDLPQTRKNHYELEKWFEQYQQSQLQNNTTTRN